VAHARHAPPSHVPPLQAPLRLENALPYGLQFSLAARGESAHICMSSGQLAAGAIADVALLPAHPQLQLRLRLAREWSGVVAEFVGGAWRGSVAPRVLLHDPHGRPAQVASCLRCLDTVPVVCHSEPVVCHSVPVVCHSVRPACASHR